MNQPDTDVTYHVVYQETGRPEWFVFTNTRNLWEHPVPHGMLNQTTDLAEAEAAARGLVERTVFIDDRPKYQRQVVAAQVYQTVTTGGVVRTFGEPHPEG